MKYQKGYLLRQIIRAFAYGAVGVVLTLLVVGIMYLNNQPDLDVWHTAKLNQDFKADSKINNFDDYLLLEDRLFRQLDDSVYAKLPAASQMDINRYHRGSLSDPNPWQQNWNRSFELTTQTPKAGVLLLHGMSDSPYSLRQMAERLHASGAYVVGMRMPGHGTAPSGLTDITWQDMAAATEIGMRQLQQKTGDAPLYIIGYSTGAALAVQYALKQQDDKSLPRVAKLILISPAIGVTPAAKFAIWQARIGHLLGLEKLEWNAILPEYDPYKYGSFAVNAGDVVYQLTVEIQSQLNAQIESGAIKDFPPILAFSSIVDATVQPIALVLNLFDRLPTHSNELVLFDINRVAPIKPIMKSNPNAILQALDNDPIRNFTLSIVSNRNAQTQEVVSRTRSPGQNVDSVTELGMQWPMGIYSLSHVALPIPFSDPLYGGDPTSKNILRLGDLALRGERGVLQVSATDMLRLRWNPFYPYIENRVLEFTGLNAQLPALPESSADLTKLTAK